MTPRRIISLFGGASLLLLLTAWAAISAKFPSYRFETMPCLSRGTTFLQRFRASCHAELGSPRGKIPYSINEDGIRDRPRADILAHPKRALVVGDSFAEGMWLRPEESVSGRLSQELAPAYFINAGMRASGTIAEAATIERLVPIYKPKLVLWFLSDDDVQDDRAACASARSFASDGKPETYSLEVVTENPILHHLLNGAERLGSPGTMLRRMYYQARWNRLLESPLALRCEACLSLSRIAALLKKSGTALRVILIPKIEAVMQYPYRLDPQARGILSECLKKNAIAFLDSEPLMPAEASKNYYWENDVHLNPEGEVEYVTRIAPQLRVWLSELR